ncbi:MAG: hypothetical protein QM775_01575 [Pirellulales bacterium]
MNKQMDTRYAAARGWVDRIIDPARTREELIAASRSRDPTRGEEAYHWACFRFSTKLESCVTIRIGNGSRFLGDNLDAPRRLVETARLDYLTLEYLGRADAFDPRPAARERSDGRLRPRFPAGVEEPRAGAQRRSRS